MQSELSTKVLDHLGLVSGMCDELGLVDQIDSRLPQDATQRSVSIGTICKALVLNGLGFVQRRLYMVSSFFEGKPAELLLGEGVQAAHLNDTVIGRALDEIHAYGCTRLFGELVPGICSRLGLSPRYAHMDSTDFHLDGRYNAENPPKEGENILRLTKGYSRDHRPDLNQVVLNPITENQAGIPLHMPALDGNRSDKTAFRETIAAHIGQLQNATGFDYLTMDGAGYTRETLSLHGDKSKWISRVPETIKESRELLNEALEFKELAPGYTYAAAGSSYAGVPQRWLVIRSKAAQEREVATLLKNYAKQSKEELRLVTKLEKQAFSCETDARKAAEDLLNGLKTLQLESLGLTKKARHASKGRPGKAATPERVDYFLGIRVSSPLDRLEALKRQKGKFILATNETDTGKLPDKEVLEGYKGLSKTERGFRFMKDPQFAASCLFVKKPERVEVLLFVMTLCLTVYAALEHRIRERLRAQGETLPNQLGKPVQNPTTRWVFELFTGIHLLYGMEKSIIRHFPP
jgi:transposase